MEREKLINFVSKKRTLVVLSSWLIISLTWNQIILILKSFFNLNFEFWFHDIRKRVKLNFTLKLLFELIFMAI